MTAAITGSAIGFLVWAGLSLVSKSWRTSNVAGVVYEIVIFTGSGAAIGWLIGLAS